MDWLIKFPAIDGNTLRALRRAIDDSFRDFTRGYGDMIEGLFSPLQSLLMWS